MSCEYDGCPVDKFCEDVPTSMGCIRLRAYRKGKADERKNVLDEVYRVITNQMIKHGTDLDFNLETQELILKMKGE